MLWNSKLQNPCDNSRIKKHSTLTHHSSFHIVV